MRCNAPPSMSLLPSVVAESSATAKSWSSLSPARATSVVMQRHPFVLAATILAADLLMLQLSPMVFVLLPLTRCTDVFPAFQAQPVWGPALPCGSSPHIRSLRSCLHMCPSPIHDFCIFAWIAISTPTCASKLLILLFCWRITRLRCLTYPPLT